MINHNNPAKQRCEKYTSNCVIWDGPNLILNCFDTSILRGQPISPAISQSYNLLCEILRQIDIEGLDLDCLIDVSRTAPSIRDVFDYMIERLCKIKDKLDSHMTIEQVITADLPFCFQYETPAGTVTKLEITEYYERVAARICGILSDIATINSTFNVNGSVFDELQDIEAIIEEICGTQNPFVTPSCTNNTVFNPNADPVKIQTAFEWLEDAFCSFRNFTGMPAELLTAFSYDCPNLGTLPKLNGTGNMEDYYDWVANPNTVAQSVNNLWITICDMRNAMRYVLDNCCSSLCSNLSVGYELVILPNDAGYDLIFSGLSSVRSYPLYRNAGPVANVGPVPIVALYTFSDAAATFVPGALVGKKVRITTGAGVFQSAPIVFNTATNITVNTNGTNWVSPLDGTSVYEVYEEYTGTGPAPSWVTDLYPATTLVVITLDDGANTYTINTGLDIFTLMFAGSFSFPYPVGYDFTALFKTINISFTYKHTIPIVAAVTTGTTITYTTSIDHPYQVGDVIDITAANPVGFNLTGAVVTAVPFLNQFVVNNTFVGTYSNGGGVILQSMDCVWCECCCDFSVTNGIY